MIYLGNPSSREIRSAMSHGLLACMTTPAQGNPVPEQAFYACDNGRFGKGWPGHAAWFDWLCRTVFTNGSHRCLWAVAPDVPLDARATLRTSRPWLASIRGLGIKAAFAAQDGCESPGLLPWGEFDALFLAGSTEWKTGRQAAALAREGHNRGIAVHMGRVNSRARLRKAEAMGCHSSDGTYLTYGPEMNLPRLLSWLDELNRQPALLPRH
jgi:hypothetical protein